MSAVTIRTAVPEDYDPIAAVVDGWWGRDVVDALPRLFLDHFHSTSYIAETDGGMVGFLIGFLSPSHHDQAYIHFVGVDPLTRQSGLARRLYEKFFALAHAEKRSVIRAVTGTVNTQSIAFHRRMGFTVTEPVHDYDGPGGDRVCFTLQLSRRT